MNIDTSNPQPPVAILFNQVILPFLPAAERESVERELPTLALLAYQLGLDVLVAEQQGIPYFEAVKRPEFLKMGRVYHGASNLLQFQLPAAMRKVLNAMLSHALAGRFDPTRKMLFAIASRKNDPQAALCRFFLWIAVRLNLLIITWDDPAVELRGTLSAMDEEAEVALRKFIEESESIVQEDDIRPLHTLIAEMIIHAYIHDNAIIGAMSEFKSELQELMTNADALERVRGLDARSAAAIWPGDSETPLGSQQIADRFPQHFPSANAMEKHRSRLLQTIGERESVGDRFIDVVRAKMEEGQ